MTNRKSNRTNARGGWLTLAAALALTLAGTAETKTVAMLPSEKWWGVMNYYGTQMPFDAKTDLTMDVRADNMSNQAASFLVSDRGRSIWCDEQTKVTIRAGRIEMTSARSPVELDASAKTLREAFRKAAAKHFPPSGRTPDLLFFSAPQYNTWIELTYHQNERDILAYAQSMLDNGLPPGVLMIDDTWQAGYGDWRFEPTRFPDPKGMMAKLHAMGFKVILWMCPYVSMDTPAYRRIAWGSNPDDVKGYPTRGGFLGERDGRTHGHFKTVEPAAVSWWNGKSAHLDLTHPNAQAWFREQLDRLVRDYGADGFKFDGGHFGTYARGYRTWKADATSGEQVLAYARYALDYPVTEYRNAWRFQGQPVVERLHDKGHRWDELAKLVPDMIAGGLLGHPFMCPDMVGGGSWTAFLPGAPFDPDLFVRSAQVHALCGMMQFSASPWRYLDARRRQIVRDLVKMRQEKFAAYFVELAKECGRTGEPMIRNLEYAYPGRGYAAIRDEFLMGDRLLVAPQVVKDAATRTVTVPPGTWRADDGSTVVGPATVTVATPLERLPYFERIDGAAAAKRPEICWSVMHPTAIDTNYMARVAAKAVEYGGVDSFEVCGDCHRGYSGINGLSFLEKYPHAAAKVDRAAVEKNRRDMNAICAIAHAVGKPLYYWHREIFIPSGLLEDLPQLLDADGEFDLLGETYQNWLRYKLDETFRHCPGLDGIVLTLTEADYSVIHNSNPKRYPPQEVVERLVGLFAEEHERRGKRFILRSFGSNSQDYIDIIGGAKRAAAKHAFEIETKITEADFVPWLPKNPFLKKNPPLTLGAECDVLGEYLSAGYLPAAQVARIREYVDSAREEGTDRYALRIDRVGNSIFDSAHEVNLYAYMRFIADPSATVDGVIAEYAAKRFGAAAEGMIPLVKDELEMIRNIHYVASNLVFHSFPLKSDFKTVKAGGIFSVYRENSSLEATKDIWSILSWMKTPPHAQILAEKAKGVAMADAALRRVEALKDRMPADEYARQHRAFANATKAARALEAYAKCCVAYFEDMAADAEKPDRLARESAAAVRLIESLMTDPNDAFTGREAYFSVVGGNLDRVYFTGLRFYCRELLNEYALEQNVRRPLRARGDVIDFVVPGGIYDDNRTIRTMHGAYTKTLPGRVVRQAGNPIFPNGTITVRFRDVPGAKVEVALDPSGAKVCETKESVADGWRTVTVGKKGREYPAVLSIALVKSGK